ncbi:kinase-interacting family protein [Eutrema salsugineum]|uniref:kinase-interacting family protein n=1 Tax=Eutrema salsugineum TaxID=72664 RepID=UPI000CED6418|nr:kinase-interacting family protein [Eutrema salsugineum]
MLLEKTSMSLKKMKSKGSMDATQPQLPSLSDVEARMQILRESAFEESQGDDDTFAHRAEWFYQRRPLLLSLCLDLYNGYVTLLARSHQTRPKQQLKLTTSPPNDHEDCISDIDSGSEIGSEVESTLSFQQVQDSAAVSEKVDGLVSQLVTANLDKEILQDELLRKEQQLHEASNTIELLKKFVMLLEMEKEVAMQENANLGYKVTSLLEENRELATEALFMKNEAVGLARCVLKMRDDHFHKVCILQNRIYSLQASKNLEPVYDKVSAGCFGLDKHKTKKKMEKKAEEKTGFKWLKKLNNINLFTKCSVNPSAAAAAPSCCTFNLPN